jgi:chromosome segregation ATPase
MMKKLNTLKETCSESMELQDALAHERVRCSKLDTSLSSAKKEVRDLKEYIDSLQTSLLCEQEGSDMLKGMYKKAMKAFISIMHNIVANKSARAIPHSITSPQSLSPTPSSGGSGSVSSSNIISSGAGQYDGRKELLKINFNYVEEDVKNEMEQLRDLIIQLSEYRSELLNVHRSDIEVLEDRITQLKGDLTESKSWEEEVITTKGQLEEQMNAMAAKLEDYKRKVKEYKDKESASSFSLSSPRGSVKSRKSSSNSPRKASQ